MGDALSSPVDRELLTGQQADPKKRKTKREILEFRNVDVDQVTKLVDKWIYIISCCLYFVSIEGVGKCQLEIAQP